MRTVFTNKPEDHEFSVPGDSQMYLQYGFFGGCRKRYGKSGILNLDLRGTGLAIHSLVSRFNMSRQAYIDSNVGHTITKVGLFNVIGFMD